MQDRRKAGLTAAAAILALTAAAVAQRGTPAAGVRNPDGHAGCNDSHIEADRAEALIRSMIGEGNDNSMPTLDENRPGQDLLGAEMPELRFDAVLESDNASDTPPTGDEKPKGAEDDAEPDAVLYRWWTDGCPHCRASLPAMERLREEFGERGLRVVAVHHPKPPQAVDAERMRDTAAEYGYTGDLATDEDWSELRKAYLDPGPRRPATSVSILVDSEGTVRFVHPGPDVFPADIKADGQANSDYETLRDALDALLPEAEEKSPADEDGDR